MAETKKPDQKPGQPGQPDNDAKPLPLVDKAQWDRQDGESYGGQSDVMALKPGEAAGPLTYLGHQELTTDLGPTTAHTAQDANKVVWRLPIHATFQRAVDQANLGNGDIFYVRRHEDVNKKKGKGAGKPMQIWEIKVISRAARPVAA